VTLAVVIVFKTAKVATQVNTDVGAAVSDSADQFLKNINKR